MESFVSLTDLASHLRFLGAVGHFLFVLLDDHLQVSDGALCPTSTGQVFLQRSAHRLKVWITCILHPKYLVSASRRELEVFEMPPFDVLVMLHAYMLHPRAFYEDTIRLHPELAVLNGFPLTQAAALINDSMEYTPSTEQIIFWEKMTGEVFSPPLQTSASDEFTITCPACHLSISISWIVATRKGSPGGIKFPCPQCRAIITDEILGMANILTDLGQAISGSGVGLAGTLLTAEGNHIPQLSRTFSHQIAAAIDFKELSRLPLNEANSALKSRATMVIVEHTSADFGFLNRYGHSNGFSIDITSAALRQIAFAYIMHDAGWTVSRFPLEASATMKESISRYKSFLYLTMGPEERAMGPTPEIDLVWHTHQLSANYRDNLVTLFGWFLDHVDVEASPEDLSHAKSNACDTWEIELGTPYENFFSSTRFCVDGGDCICLKS